MDKAIDTYSQPLLNKKQLQERLNLASARGVDELVRRRKIPVLRLGHRTLRFDWLAVCKALAKLEIQAVQ